MKRPCILIMSDYYLPGFKAGGPIRTLANTVEYLGDDFSFIVLTRNHDLGYPKSYSGIGSEYVRVGKAKVSYLVQTDLTFNGMKKCITEAIPDIIYLNSFFSKHFSIIPAVLLRSNQVPKVPIVLAPRGEFAPSALKIKSFRKRCYLTIAKICGLCRQFVWQASGEHEASDIRREFPNSQIVIAPDLPPLVPKVCLPKKQEKVQGSLKLVFLSRISPMKNLHGALHILRNLNEGKIVFDIWGPIEDQSYWQECERLLRMLPNNITATYQGAVIPERVHEILSGYDIFFLPTMGENFGHAILEALGAGLPVVISDRTQWRKLTDHHAGWDIPLDDITGFIQVLKHCVNMDAGELNLWVDGAHNYAKNFSDIKILKEKTELLFLKCLNKEYQSNLLSQR